MKVNDWGYMECKPKEEHIEEDSAMRFKSKICLWVVLYFFIPAVTIVLLNAGIVYRLAKAQTAQAQMRSPSMKFNKANGNSANMQLLSRNSNGSSVKVAKSQRPLSRSQSTTQPSLRYEYPACLGLYLYMHAGLV